MVIARETLKSDPMLFQIDTRGGGRVPKAKSSWANALKAILLFILLGLWVLFAGAFSVLWGTVLFVEFVMAPLVLLYVSYLVFLALKRAAGKR